MKEQEEPAMPPGGMDTKLQLQRANEVVVMPMVPDDHKLARDIIDVHGREAATVARENARAAALAGQAMQARLWIRVLGIIQRQQADRASAIGTVGQSYIGNPKL
jgi:hypothetical protein